MIRETVYVIIVYVERQQFCEMCRLCAAPCTIYLAALDGSNNVPPSASRGRAVLVYMDRSACRYSSRKGGSKMRGEIEEVRKTHSSAILFIMVFM